MLTAYIQHTSGGMLCIAGVQDPVLRCTVEAAAAGHSEGRDGESEDLSTGNVSLSLSLCLLIELSTHQLSH